MAAKSPKALALRCIMLQAMFEISVCDDYDYELTNLKDNNFKENYDFQQLLLKKQLLL